MRSHSASGSHSASMMLRAVVSSRQPLNAGVVRPHSAVTGTTGGGTRPSPGSVPPGPRPVLRVVADLDLCATRRRLHDRRDHCRHHRGWGVNRPRRGDCRRGGRPPRNLPCTQVCMCIAASTPCRARSTSRRDWGPSRSVNAWCTGSSSLAGPSASGSHSWIPCARSAVSTARTGLRRTLARTRRSRRPRTGGSRLPSAVPQRVVRTMAADGKTVVEVLDHDHAVPSDRLLGDLALPARRRCPVLELDRGHPSVEREPQLAALGSVLAASGAGLPRRVGCVVVAQRVALIIVHLGDEAGSGRRRNATARHR